MNISRRQADYDDFVSKVENDIVLEFYYVRGGEERSDGSESMWAWVSLKEPENWDKFSKKGELLAEFNSGNWKAEKAPGWYCLWDVMGMDDHESKHEFLTMLKRMANMPDFDWEMLESDMEAWDSKEDGVFLIYKARLKEL